MAFIQKILLTFITLATALTGLAESSTPQSLEVKRFKVCGLALQLEVADQENERIIGLMHRPGLGVGKGMLFVFEGDDIRQFWMRNVPFDIDIGYFDAQGKFVRALTMLGTSPVVSDDRLPRYSSEKPARYAVEVEKGFFSKIKNPKACTLSPRPKAL